jgi:hypothetical protein
VRFVLALLLVPALAGCGGYGDASTSTRTRTQPAHAQAKPPQDRPVRANPFPDDPQILARTTTEEQRRALGVLAQDIVRMRAASADTPGHSLKGTGATRHATSGFISHLEQSRIDDVSKNRLIDHAAAAVAFACDQCFQQLEAMRPIPAIAH